MSHGGTFEGGHFRSDRVTGWTCLGTPLCFHLGWLGAGRHGTCRFRKGFRRLLRVRGHDIRLPKNEAGKSATRKATIMSELQSVLGILLACLFVVIGIWAIRRF